MEAAAAGTPRVAFIGASWHAETVEQARLAFVEEVGRLSGGNARVDVFAVPGALEIPLHAKTLAGSGTYDAIVGCALVVDGGIYRHEFVAQAVLDGLMAVQLSTEVPFFSLVLTPQDYLTEGREQYFFEHFSVKGREAASACVQTLAARAALTAA